MRKDLTDIVVVMDRSGSMTSCKNDAEGGLNTFVAKQKEQPGSADFTLIQFDDRYECVHAGIPIKDVPTLSLVPRGNTALLDAIGRAIVETGERLSKVPKALRPGLVVFVILTDGEENASTEYTGAKIKEMIQHQTDVYNWQFTYLGANQDAFAVADTIGIAKTAASNFSARNAANAYKGAANNVMRMRNALAEDAPIACSYTDEERTAMS